MSERYRENKNILHGFSLGVHFKLIIIHNQFMDLLISNVKNKNTINFSITIKNGKSSASYTFIEKIYFKFQFSIVDQILLNIGKLMTDAVVFTSLLSELISLSRCSISFIVH